MKPYFAQLCRIASRRSAWKAVQPVSVVLLVVIAHGVAMRASMASIGYEELTSQACDEQPDEYICNNEDTTP